MAASGLVEWCRFVVIPAHADHLSIAPVDVVVVEPARQSREAGSKHLDLEPGPHADVREPFGAVRDDASCR
jgi:hypothetical protein